MNLLAEALNPLQLTAIIFLAAVFLFAFLGLKRETGLAAQIATIAPNILISIGIFFTFLGILIALQNFNVSNVTSSIPKLLEGLKLAFLSSVVGLGLSVFFRGLQAWTSQDMTAGDVSAGDLLSELKKSNKNTLLVRDALIGDGEASLSTQFGKLRNDFRDFADKAKEDGTQALVKALEEVIRDFNEQISEQFGDNFKQLNEAVGALLEWQKQYKEQVELLTHAFENTSSGITKIEETTAKIPEHMQSIETTFNKTEDRLEKLYEGFSSLSAMRESAQQAVPELQDSIDKMTAGLRESVDKQSELVKKQLDEMGERQSVTNDEIKSLTKELNESINKSLANSVESMNQSFQALDNGMQESLQRSLDKMGNNLTAITDRFIKIYEDNAGKIIALTKSLTGQQRG